MKFYSVMFVVLIVFSVCHGFSQPRIPNTKAEGCDASGNCGSVCSYDGVNIFPSQTYNAPGKCRLYQCTEDFTTLITPCPFDLTRHFEWINPDDTKHYPECCGVKTPLTN